MSADEQRELEEEQRREEAVEERKRILQARQRRLSAIAEHPDWPEVVAEAERYVALQRGKVTDLALSEAALDQRSLDYIRGLCDGYMAFVKTPGNALKALMDALEEAVADEEHRRALRIAEEELHYA